MHVWCAVILYLEIIGIFDFGRNYDKSNFIKYKFLSLNPNLKIHYLLL